MLRTFLIICAAMLLPFRQSTIAGPGPCANFDYYHANVQKIRQPDSMSCWAAALTMLYSFKQGNMHLKIEDVLASIDVKFLKILKSGKGIMPEDETELYKKVMLRVKRGLNPTIAGWIEVLKTGPLSVTVDAKPPLELFHALVVTGLKGDGKPGGTHITYIDPADGKERTVLFENFLKLYEGSANWPLQIIYW